MNSRLDLTKVSEAAAQRVHDWATLPMASTVIGALMQEADRILAGKTDGAINRLETIGIKLEAWRGKMTEYPPFVSDAEEMLLMALGQMLDRDTSHDARAKWGRVAKMIKDELVGQNLLDALAREARPTP